MSNRSRIQKQFIEATWVLAEKLARAKIHPDADAEDLEYLKNLEFGCLVADGVYKNGSLGGDLSVAASLPDLITKATAAINDSEEKDTRIAELEAEKEVLKQKLKNFTQVAGPGRGHH